MMADSTQCMSELTTVDRQAAAPAPASRGREGAGRSAVVYQHAGDPPGLDPTRYGDWEYHGRCTDF